MASGLDTFELFHALTLHLRQACPAASQVEVREFRSGEATVELRTSDVEALAQQLARLPGATMTVLRATPSYLELRYAPRPRPAGGR
jgi:hypothetical protein